MKNGEGLLPISLATDKQVISILEECERLKVSSYLILRTCLSKLISSKKHLSSHLLNFFRNPLIFFL